jgi:hypothetical protein
MGQPRSAARIGLLARHDPYCAELAAELVGLAAPVLAVGYLGGEFAFTLRADGAGPGAALRAEGTSVRYTAIAALGLRHESRSRQRAVLAGDDCDHLLGLVCKRLDELTDRGDVALLCWAAAEAQHSELPHALDRLRRLDQPDDPLDVVAAAWIVTALAAARPLADVEPHLAAARRRLMSARRAVFPHVIGGAPARYRSHVGSFADQIYPVQALARLHASGDDPAALAVADELAGVMCREQGEHGQWWWHYDARSGTAIEGYPVYSVHQHAMAPMGLLDLADAGGDCHLAAICRGLRWEAAPPETPQRLIDLDRPVIWRKVARRDPRKLVRGLAAAHSAIRPGKPAPGLHRIFPPNAVDRECRPYELGWLLYAWLSGAAA